MRYLAKAIYTLLLIAVLLALPAVYLAVACTGGAGAPQAATPPLSQEARELTDARPGYRRDEQRTYLTFPEWFIVYVSQDYAAFIRDRWPSGFAYADAITGFWTSYCAVNRVVSSRYPFSFPEHLTIYVIGISHTLEYGIKGLYENTIGRLSEYFAPAEPTDEDRFGRSFAEDYASTLDTVPWYEYRFYARLKDLWQETSLSGPGMVRKWERKFALSAELAVKAVYAWIIGGGTAAAYGSTEPQETMAVLQGLGALPPGTEKTIELYWTFADGSALVIMPRYQPFTPLVDVLADTGARFLDIAGNDEILITAIMPKGATLAGTREALFETPVLSGEGGTRTGFSVPVTELLASVRAIEAAGGRFEHAYDY